LAFVERRAASIARGASGQARRRATTPVSRRAHASYRKNHDRLKAAIAQAIVDAGKF